MTPLLQHLREAAAHGSNSAPKSWDGDLLKAVLCEAARLGDLPLLDWLAASAQQAGQQWAQQHLQHKLQQAEQLWHSPSKVTQWRVAHLLSQLQAPQQRHKWVRHQCQQYLCDVARTALDAAAGSGHTAMPQLAATAICEHAAAHAQRLLQLAVSDFAADAAKSGQLAVLQLLLADAGPHLDTSQLLCAAIRGNQLPTFQLLLGKASPPADAGAVLLAAVKKGFLAGLRRLAAKAGLPAAGVGPLLMAAIVENQPAAARFLAEHGSLPANTEPLLTAAIQHGLPGLVPPIVSKAGLPADVLQLVLEAIAHSQPAVAQLLLEAGSPPAEPEALLAAAIQHDQPELVPQIISTAGVPADVERLAVAAATKDQPGVVQLLLTQSGQAPSAAMLRAAIHVPSPACLLALLAAGDGPVAVPPPAGWLSLPTSPSYTCPVLATLQLRARRMDLHYPVPAPLAKLLLIMEALQAAGYRPTVYHNVQLLRLGAEQVQLAPRYDPIADDPRLDLQGLNRFLWLALERPQWSPDNHHRFMPRFKRAVQTVLLAVHRARRSNGASSSSSSSSAAGSGKSSAGGGSGSALLRQLAALPNELLLHIVGEAAYPLSAWTPGS